METFFLPKKNSWEKKGPKKFNYCIQRSQDMKLKVKVTQFREEASYVTKTLISFDDEMKNMFSSPSLSLSVIIL